MMFGLVMNLLAVLIGGAQMLSVVIYPTVLLLASMFHTSIWFTFRDSFVTEDASPPAPLTGENT